MPETSAQSEQVIEQTEQAPYYEGLYDDAYSSEYDSVYDSSDDVVYENASDYENAENEENLAITENVETQPAANTGIYEFSERELTTSETAFVKRDKTKSERRHHPHYFMTFGVAGNFHFDTFIGKESSLTYTNIFGGLSGSIRFGMIGQDFHWSIEQVFGHIWGLRIDSGSKDMTRYDAATLVEASMVTPIKRKLSGIFTIGAGFFYNMPHTGQSEAYGDYLAVDDNGTNLAVGIKLSASIVYDITQYFSIGADLAYILGIDIGSYAQGEFADRNGNYYSNDTVLLEMLQPGIFCMVKF